MNITYNKIDEVCKKIEKSWQKINFNCEDFYKIVSDYQNEFDFSNLGEITNQVQLLQEPQIATQQVPSTFSDMYFKLFDNGRFLIEILNWWGGHVNIHDHDFTAVQFQLKGKSLNVVYDFDEQEKFGALTFGKLNVRNASIWNEGSKNIVRHGNLDPHCVFHIGRPTTSLLIRTHPTSRLGAQSNYFPSLKAHYYVNSTVQRKKLTGLSLLSKSQPHEFKKCLNIFLNEQSLSENFFMLLKLGQICFQSEYIEILKNYARRGIHESKIIENVACNNAIDFFKNKANIETQLSDSERIALFALSASRGQLDLQLISEAIESEIKEQDFDSLINSFYKKLPTHEQQKAKNFYKILTTPGVL